MSWAEYLCDLATCPAELHELKDESIDRGPVAEVPVWKEHAFILSRGLVPLVVQQLAYWALPSTSLRDSSRSPNSIGTNALLSIDVKWPLAIAYPFYWVSFVAFALQVVKHLNCELHTSSSLIHESRRTHRMLFHTPLAYCVKYGTFDEKQIGRDRTPDKSVPHLASGITGTSTLYRSLISSPLTSVSSYNASLHVCSYRHRLHFTLQQDGPTLEHCRVELSHPTGTLADHSRLLLRAFLFFPVSLDRRVPSVGLG